MASPVEPAAAPAPAPASNSHQIPNNSSFATQNPHPRDTKKRPLDSADDFQNFPYFKMRAVLKDLRPLFLQVIQAPDLRECKASAEIQEKVKLMLDFCRQMAIETMSSTTVKCNNTGESPGLPSENQGELKPMREHQQDMNAIEHPQADGTSVKAAEERRFLAATNNSEHLVEDSVAQGTYIVGGSAFGWNFITFTGTKPVYCGRTKESFRAAE
ncbi:hypothetical protein Dimus_006527 [Dionaea muscipula]